MPFGPRSEADWNVVASSVRLSIIQVLEAGGAASVPAVAEQLGRSAEGLYHHMRLLEKAGIARVVGHERRRRRKERVYAIEVPFTIDPSCSPTDELRRRGLRRLTIALLREAQRRFDGLLAQDSCADPTRLPGYALRHESGYLSPRAVRELRGHLDAMRAIFKREQLRAGADPSAARAGRELHHATWLVHPAQSPSALAPAPSDRPSKPAPHDPDA